MLTIFNTSLMTVLAVFTVVTFGMIFRYKNYVNDEITSGALRVVIYLMLPSLYATKLIGNDLFDNPEYFYLPPMCGFLEVLFGIILTWFYVFLVPKVCTSLDTHQKRGTFIAGLALVNYGYVPIPLISELFPGDDRMMAVLFVTNVGAEFALWTVCLFVMQGKVSWHTTKSLLNMPMLAIAFSLLLNFFGWGKMVPHGLLKPFEILGDAAIPLSLFFAGSTIAESIPVDRFFQNCWSNVKTFFRRFGRSPLNQSEAISGRSANAVLASSAVSLTTSLSEENSQESQSNVSNTSIEEPDAAAENPDFTNPSKSKRPSLLSRILHSSVLKVGLHSCLLRLGLFPFLLVWIILQLPCSHELKIVLIIHSSMASAFFPILVARMYNGCVRTAIETTLSNTIVAFLTTPLWITFGLKWLGE